MTIRVSVLIPVASLDYLDETLESVAAQTLDQSSIETILILDGILENEVNDIIPESLKRNLKFLELNNAGIVNALNLGIEIASGEYLARIDHDDVMMPSRLKRQVKFLDRHQRIGVVGSSIILINELGRFLGIRIFPKQSRRISKFLFFENVIAHPSVMIRKTALNVIGKYDDSVPEDWDLWIRFSESSNISNLRVPLIKYRVHRNQLSRDDKYSSSNSLLSLKSKHTQFFREATRINQSKVFPIIAAERICFRILNKILGLLILATTFGRNREI